MVDQSKSESLDKLKNLIEKLQTAMMTVQDPDGDLTSRPMAVQKVEGETVWFFAKRNSGKIASITDNHKVNLAFSSLTDSSFVSVAGHANVVDDKKKIHELWDKKVEAYLPDGPDDPQTILIQVTMASAEYWDAPSSKAVMLLGEAKALVTGRAHRPGDHDRIDLH